MRARARPSRMKRSRMVGSSARWPCSTLIARSMSSSGSIKVLHEVGMTDAGQGPAFANEAVADGRVIGEMAVQHLDRPLDVQQWVDQGAARGWDDGCGPGPGLRE